MRVAREWKVPHSTIIREWTVKDRKLAMAALLVRDDTGPCGQPHAVSTLDENADRYEVQTRTCHACAKADEWDRQHSDHGASAPGSARYVVDLTIPVPDEGPDLFGPTFD